MPSEPRQQLRLIAAILIAVLLALGLVYYAFFRVAMVPAYQNIRQSDASAIVVELGKASIPYSLGNDGHDVLVPEDRAAEARVAVAGSNVAMGGTVGFELFNNSDMGLTEFAQKINFQRAMQGELARTIMMTQGVDFARVHLALPERSIFRANQAAPTAAVTVQMARGYTLTPQRVDGIRQLIASSVPGLTQSAVAMLDENGALVTPVADVTTGASLDEHSALDLYYQARAKEAIAGAVPTLKYDVTVAAQRSAVPLDAANPTEAAPDRDMPDRNSLSLAVLVRTETALPADVQAKVESAIIGALVLRKERGDSLRFAIGAVVGDAAAPANAPSLSPRISPAPTTAAVAAGGQAWSARWPIWWLWGGLALLLVAILVLLLRPRRRLDDAEIRAFAAALKTSSFEAELADAG
jgi:flagellar M-ring protein FliF